MNSLHGGLYAAQGQVPRKQKGAESLTIVVAKEVFKDGRDIQRLNPEDDRSVTGHRAASIGYGGTIMISQQAIPSA